MSEINIATVENVNRDTWRIQEDGPFVATSARVLAGNMSEAYNQYGQDLDAEQKSSQALRQMSEFHESLGLPIENAFVLKPQTDYSEPLGIVNVDQVFTPGQGVNHATVSEERADFVITRDPETILECRPTDCPVLTIAGQDKDGQPLLSLLHVGWQGLNAGYLEQALHHLKDVEGVEAESLRIQMSGAGYAENFHYTNAENPLDDDSHDGDKPKRFTHPDRDSLFVNVSDTGRVNDGGQEIWSFDMDMPGFIRGSLQKHGVDPYQLYEEGSDTADPESGYSSHRRDGGDNTKNTRDVVVASMTGPNQEIINRFITRKQGQAVIEAAGRDS